ncbi:MAG: hypothetical protein R3B90_13020 [Planctomycetaceae bacterium]
MGGPFSRRELVGYRLLIICSSAVLKAGVATVLLLPDLAHPALGFVGLCLALTFIELWRFAIDIATSTFSANEYRGYRVVVLTAVAAVVGVVIAEVTRAASATTSGTIPNALVMFRSWSHSLWSLGDSGVAQLLKAPFAFFVEIFSATTIDAGLWTRLVAAWGMVWLAIEGVVRLDAVTLSRLEHRERAEFRQNLQRSGTRPNSRDDVREQNKPQRLPRVWLEPVAWRQLLGQRRSLAVCCWRRGRSGDADHHALPHAAWERMDGLRHLVASLAFYTLLLLPAAAQVRLPPRLATGCWCSRCCRFRRSA